MKAKQVDLAQGKILIGDSGSRGSASAYTFPLSSGSEGQVLTLGAGGAAAWADASSGGASSTTLNADVSVSNFAAETTYIAPYTNASGFTINLPDMRYNLSLGLALHNQAFDVVNMSTHNIVLRVADSWHYSSPTYYQTYLREPNNTGQSGIGNGEPITFTVGSFTKVSVYCYVEYNTSAIKRLSYNILT